MRIINGILVTVTGKTYQRGYVEFDDGKVTGFGDMADSSDTEDEILDAKGGYILPGFIDAHTHIGVCEEGIRWEGDDCNESTDPITPQMDVIDGFYPLDTAIGKAVQGGVTVAVVSPGSTNVIGGKIAAVKLHGTCVDEMILKPFCAIKFALGENPKRCYGQNKSKMPETRMATAAILRDALTKAKRYLNQKENGEDVYDDRWEVMIPLMQRHIPAHIHAHRSDDIMTAIRICKEFDLRYIIVHATDGAVIAQQLKEENAMVIVGPSLGPAGKFENRNASFSTAGILQRAGLEVAITTDHDCQPLQFLPIFAALCVREGMEPDAALRAITINPARIIGIEDRVGSIELGKDADICIFSSHPFDLMAKTKAVFIDGQRIC